MLLALATRTVDPPAERRDGEATIDSEQVLLERIVADARRDPANYLLRSDVGQHGE
jgi:hypothetical protein